MREMSDDGECTMDVLEESLPGNPTEPCDEVMEISSDEAAEIPSTDPQRKRRKIVIDWGCVNPNCNVNGRTNKEMVETASSFVISFYSGDTKRKRKVCAICRKIALDNKMKMIEKLMSGVSLVQEYKDQELPAEGEMVLLEDSDEKPQTDTSSESECAISDDGDGDPEQKLKSIIEGTIKKLKIDEQVNEAIAMLKAETDDMDERFREREEEFKDIEKTVEDIRMNLYAPFRPKLKFQEPITIVDHLGKEPPPTAPSGKAPLPGPLSKRNKPAPPVVSNQEHLRPPSDLPPIGKLFRPDLVKMQDVYFVQGDILNAWRKGSVLETDMPPLKGSEGEKTYKVKVPILKNGVTVTAHIRTARCRLLAYPNPASVRLQVGTRIIGVYHEPNEPQSMGDFYAGIVAEPPKAMNKHRYLVFFDDGYASYIQHKDIRVVVHQTEDQVWNDIHLNSREFIKKYLMQYPERPMVRLITGQVVRTEWEGSWWFTRVEDVDASLVRLVFHVNGRRESIYRGSTRLEPLYLEMQQQKKRSEGQVTSQKSFSRHNRNMNKPFVEYTRHADGQDSGEGFGVRRAVARKSTAASNKRPGELKEPEIRMSTKGKINQVNVTRVEGVPFVKHQCSPTCMNSPKFLYDPKKLKNINPLLIPLSLGWKREMVMHKEYGHRKIYYVAPCGRRLRNLKEVHRYLRVTSSTLEIDFFQFEWFIRPFNEFAPDQKYCELPDISYGHENFPVSCVNSLDKSYPEYIEYSTKRLPQGSVNINTDKEFMVCCDCVDDCQDREKCACWQLTIHHTNANNTNQIDPTVGYNYRRLKMCVQTGIFECNPRCKCKSTCLNRVAQKPLRQKLQVFKTEKRGWGIRALHDIPEGSFLCIYVGNLYTNEEANLQGQAAGDEYFAELDMIETNERQKEGYESDVEEDLNDEDEDDDCKVVSEEDSSKRSNEKDGDYSADTEPDDDPEFVTGAEEGGETDRTTRSRRKILDKAANKTTLGIEEKRATLSFDAPMNTQKTTQRTVEDQPKFISTRKFFGKDEDVYIMDAKSIGNIGRYLNHSCNPNVFVQNCFVDTHDLRFPWVAFFTNSTVKAGDELCWDYQYVVDQVKGKEINCACGGIDCRGRLL